MFFNSFVFFIYLAIVLPIFYVLPKRGKVVHLLVASYIFYGYWDWRFCSLLALSTVVDFIVGQALHGRENPAVRKKLLMVSMAVNLGILGIFKYFNFFIGSIEMVSAGLGFQVDQLHLNIILPVGVSFYTFQTMSYTIDIYRRRLEPTKSFLEFALFVAFFPQLVAGPIERARNLLPQISRLANPTRQQVSEGLVLMVSGLFKKVMIGDTTGRIVDNIFGQHELYSGPEYLFALLLFSIQIYADFSGYSSIARGVAKLVGCELMVNFEQPYLSANITEFWRRWHISLSSWLKDYLYITLGGNRLGNVRTYANLMTTMMLGGLWHGASWNFVVWGALHGIYLATHKFFLGDRPLQDRFQYTGPASLVSYLGKMLLTNLLVLLAWLFFRANSFGQSFDFLDGIIHWQSNPLVGRYATMTLAFGLAVAVFDILEYKTRSHVFLARFTAKPVAAGVCLAMFATVVLYMATAKPLPFVYFQF